MTRHNNAVMLVLLMTTVGWRLLSMTDLKSYSMPECVFGETVRHSKSCCCDCFNIHRPQPNLIDPCQYSSVSFLFFCFWLCLTACLFFPYKERFKKDLGPVLRLRLTCMIQRLIDLSCCCVDSVAMYVSIEDQPLSGPQQTHTEQCVCVFTHSVAVCVWVHKHFLPVLTVPFPTAGDKKWVPTLHHLNEVSVKHHITWYCAANENNREF